MPSYTELGPQSLNSHEVTTDLRLARSPGQSSSTSQPAVWTLTSPLPLSAPGLCAAWFPFRCFRNCCCLVHLTLEHQEGTRQGARPDRPLHSPGLWRGTECQGHPALPLRPTLPLIQLSQLLALHLNTQWASRRQRFKPESSSALKTYSVFCLSPFSRYHPVYQLFRPKFSTVWFGFHEPFVNFCSPQSFWTKLLIPSPLQSQRKPPPLFLLIHLQSSVTSHSPPLVHAPLQLEWFFV